ncbi:MAG: Rab family GTPase [Candidatus Kariarchaeaceae archaeon]|jgi:GTPase SAR1 family protein
MDRIISKVVLIGDPSKTELRKNYFGEGFQTDILNAIGTDFALKVIQINQLAQIEIQCWDINTTNQFRKLRQKFYKGLSSVILVFDVLNEVSLYSLEQWFSEICKITRCKDISIILLGVNSDKPKKKLSFEDVFSFIEEICNSYGINQSKFSYFETSLESGENIDICFQQLGQIAHKRAQIVV